MTEDTTFAPGTLLGGRYQVRRELGRGGMGVVLLCRDRVCDERVAVKLLLRAGREVKPEEAWWFHEEARALAGLSHPSLVRARDFGNLPDGTPYLVMDAVPGRSLHEWIYLAHTDGLLPWPIVYKTVDDVLSALAHAHARGITHGDLKPSNVLVEIPTDGSPAIVSVLDLGLAWLMRDRVDHRLDGKEACAPTVRWGAGTPGWMAPEQIRYATPHVGPATDLYALGCILFALLSDREPYEGDNDALFQQHKSAPVPVPDTPPGVPAGVAPFVMRLMAKRPWDRYEFAADARRVWRTFEPRTDASSTPIPRGATGADPRKPAPDEITLPDTEWRDVGQASVITTGLLGLRPSPLVAREAERTRLLRIAADVANKWHRGEPVHQLIMLEGQAGVGKSRLAEWLCEEVHERALMVPLRARYRRIAAPLDGVVGAVTQHYRLEGAKRDLIEKVLMNLWNIPANDEAGRTWIAAAGEWIRPHTPDEDEVGPTGKRFALDRPELRALVIRRTLEQIGQRRPILLWMDDLHLASPSTFEHLLRLHRDALRLGLLVVATTRSEAIEPGSAVEQRLAELRDAFPTTQMRIEPLDVQQTHALLRETLPLDDRAIAEAAARSKGNPLFALQVVHAWANNGQLELHNGRYTVPRAAMAARAETTADLWEERLLALPEELRAAALAASALGGDIRADVLGSLLTRLGLDAAQALLAMQRSHLLLGSGGERLRWPHALLQEHLLTRLFAEPNANEVFRAASAALAIHPNANTRRILRHRVTSLIRAGDIDDAASLLHQAIAQQWSGVRDASAALRDLGLLDGKLSGKQEATHRRWRAEALRHTGKLEAARREAEEARRYFHAHADPENEAYCLKLLGHVASDLATPAHGRRLVARALTLFEGLGNEQGRAQCEVILGEIEYLLGEHAHARLVLTTASARFEALGNGLGLAQCLILQAFVEQAGSSPAHSQALLKRAREVLEPLGYRLGLAQCDVAMGHTLHRQGKLTEASAMAIGVRQAFRELANPRGEAAAERLLSMTSLDMGDDQAAQTHAEQAQALYAKLADPWGEVESRLLLAQVALDRGDTEAASGELIACEAIALVEAEPKQHRHLTLAWLACKLGDYAKGARELDAARASFKEATRTGDHTIQLLNRFERLRWPSPAGTRVTEWLRVVRQPTSRKATERRYAENP